jgi:CheY-like chemotaxis protein
LRQILFCLVSNAIKFTESGEVLTRAKLSEETESTVVVQFDVVDTGIGIAPEATELLFQTFTQIDGSRTRKYGGTGIGLSIAKQLTKLFDGEIGVKSEVGKGSTFWFRVPLERSAGQKELSGYAEAELAGLQVLLVTDNARQRSILEKQLGQWGAKITSTENGPGVLKMLREAANLQQPYSLAILDLQMAGMDGLTLARQISADGATAQVATLILTANPMLLPSKVVTEANVAACLKKPFRRSHLHDCLLKLKEARWAAGVERVAS